MEQDSPLAELLARLQRHPSECDIEDAAEIYASEAATEPERAAIRSLVSTTRKLMFACEAWTFGLSEADPERFVRLRGAAISMSDGWPDSRDAFLAAKALTQFADEHGGRCRAILDRLVSISTPRVQHLFRSPTLNMTLWS